MLRILLRFFLSFSPEVKPILLHRPLETFFHDTYCSESHYMAVD